MTAGRLFEPMTPAIHLYSMLFAIITISINVTFSPVSVLKNHIPVNRKVQEWAHLSQDKNCHCKIEFARKRPD